jgi:hypothetical protein
LSDFDELKADPAKKAPELLYPEDTNGDGEATIGSVPNPSARANQTTDDTGIPHGVAPDDISNDARETLGQYLGLWTKQNSYPVSSTAQTASPIVAAPSSDQDVFYRQFRSDPNEADTITTLIPQSLGIDATKLVEKGEGNTVLQDVVGVGLEGAYLNPTSEIEASAGEAARVGSICMSANRFSQGPNQNMTERQDPKQFFMTQRATNPLGVGPLGKYNAVSDGVTLAQVSNMAEEMLLRASGEGGAANSGQAALSLGSGIQVMTKRVQDVGNTFSPTKILGVNPEPISWGPNSNDTRISYGTLNNPLEKFGGPLPIGMIVLAVVTAIGVIVIALVLGILLDIFALIPGFPPEKGDATNPAKMGFGARFGKADYGRGSIGMKIYQMLGLPMLSAEYGMFFKFTIAAATGAITFFIPRLFGVSAGFYTIVNRNAIRDFEQVQEAVGSADFSNPVGVIESIFLIIDAFTSSATFKLLTTLIALGDQIKMGGGLGKLINSTFAEFHIDLEKEPQAPKISDLHLMGRMASGVPTQALSLGNLPLLLVMPTVGGKPLTSDVVSENADDIFKVQDDETSVVIGGAVTDTGESFESRYEMQPNGRIPTEYRERIEAMLNAYFMPFYFHDLRTNEIVPLHCFVENISDSFSPQYDAVNGFGRMDPVQVYKGTTRTIGFSFWIAAMGPADYSVMWASINKLVTMMYPQWSKGDVRECSDGTRFVMPYSQVPTSSPLIRIRLGELFSNNSAPESIKRLFGFGNDDLFTLGEDFLTAAEAGGALPPDEQRALRAGGVKQMIASSLAMTAAWDPSTWSAAQVAATGLLHMGGAILDAPMPLNLVTNAGHPGTVVSIPAGAYPLAKWNGVKFKRTWKKARFDTPTLGVINQYACTPLSVTKDDEGDPSGVKPRDNRQYWYVLTPYEGPETVSFDLEKMFPKASGLLEKITGVMIKCEAATLVHQATITSFIAMQNSTIVAKFEAAESKAEDAFFSPDSNSIVRSFKNAGGGGLAGVITSMDFDWNAAPWEYDAKAGRAPKFVKISMGFAPIHDITPGLAYDGSMRAPVYPVGGAIDAVYGERHALPADPSPADRAAAAAAEAQAKRTAIAEEVDSTSADVD